MSELSRKKREILERDQRILDAACVVLREQGYEALNMNKIASQIEYARSTVYQHYANKEEIVAAVCIRNMQTMSDMFDRALEYQGTSRERMLAVMLAYELFVQCYPQEFADMQTIKNQAVRNKICTERRETLLSLERHVVDCLSRLVSEAINNKELRLDAMQPQELVFGLWALAFGTLTLQFSDIPLADMGIHHPISVAHMHARQLLDGYGWLPLSTQHDYNQTAQAIKENIFANEYNILSRATEAQLIPINKDRSQGATQ